jgi:HEAT repeat protein
VDELEAQYYAFKSDLSFTGLSQYALICALWERPTKDAVPILLKILAEDPNAPHEELVQILMQVADIRAVEPLLSLLNTLDDENDEYGHLRAAIVEALGAIGSKRALPTLHRILETVSQDTLKLADYTQWAIEQLSNE